ncbi:MAG TPA: bifunctional diguanylate cyclase/phosphodiesterase [Rickettsiales bacterium]|nr:bifunctional diguanylate cyclase/phosphodiesterase [Rickettsiales bacterium]
MFSGKQHITGNTVPDQYEPYRHLFTPGAAPHSLTPRSSKGFATTTATGYNTLARDESRPDHSVRDYDYPPHFVESLNHAVMYAKQESHTGSLLIISINNLAMIIGTYGHEDAEKVMHHICNAITECTASSGIVDRIGFDQIGVIMHSCNKEGMHNHAKLIAHVIQDYGASSPIGALHVTCSIGSTTLPEGDDNATSALDRAYIALRNTYGNAYCTYDDMREENMQNRQQMGLANYLRRAIADNRLRLAYQPVIDTKNGGISHYEALLRVISKDGKISSAGSLIPIAERMGLIDMIDQMVFDMVVKELATSSNVTLAFNVSNMTTNNHQWLKYATSVLREYPDVARRMIVEITETAAQHDLRSTAYFVASLQAQGCKVALDDFGSGYTSFRQLKALDVDMVKIDGAFIKDITENQDNHFFVKTLLDFTHGFGLVSVAEYIEKGETAKMLMDMGVNLLQGYYFGKPENYRSWLSDGEYKKD